LKKNKIQKRRKTNRNDGITIQTTVQNKAGHFYLLRYVACESDKFRITKPFYAIPPDRGRYATTTAMF